MTKRSKSTDNNQHFYCPITEHKDIYKQNNWTNTSTQRNHKNSLMVADTITKRVIRNSQPM